MAKEISYTRYRDGLKKYVKSEIQKDYDPNMPHMGLRYWINYNKNKQNLFKNNLSISETTVLSDEEFRQKHNRDLMDEVTV